MKTNTLIINKRTGCIEWLNPPPFAVPVVKQTKQRYSEIIPLDPLPRLLFRLLRFFFGEQGKVSNWTRTWRVMWISKIKLGRWRGSEFVTPFRQAAVEWEHERWSQPERICTKST